MVERDAAWLFFSGSSHPALAAEITRFLGQTQGKIAIERFPDGEIGIQILENVRGKDIFLLQSIARRPNHYLMELLIIVDALKRASAKSISVLLPYYGYARQDRKNKGRTPITAKLVADLLEKAGVTRVLTLDLHTEQIQGFFDIPVDNLYARPLFVHAIWEMGLQDIVVVSPDVGSNKLARRFAEDLKADIAIVDKRRIDESAGKVEVSALIGDVKGKNALIVDDICSTGSTLAAAAKVCRREGAKSVYAFITHGFSAARALEGDVLDGVYFTDSIPPMEKLEWVKTVSVASLFGQAVQRLLAAESISSLFKS